jgi:hypothetical protein
MTEHPAIAFARAVLHGDEEHRAWLMEAAEAFVEGRPLPAVRADTTSPRRPGGAEAMREAAAKVADGLKPYHFHFETAAAIRSLPLPAGDTLSTGGWNSDMEKAPKDGTPILLDYGDFVPGVPDARVGSFADAAACAELGYSEHDCGGWVHWTSGADFYVEAAEEPHRWAFLPEPPPGE